MPNEPVLPALSPAIYLRSSIFDLPILQLQLTSLFDTKVVIHVGLSPRQKKKKKTLPTLGIPPSLPPFS